MIVGKFKWNQGILMLLVFTSVSFQQPSKIYLETPTIPVEDIGIMPSIETFEDSISGQTISQVKDSSGAPIFYFIRLRTGVCFDNKCRPLDVLVYWNITGRFLGYELPEGEFLSKYDHQPFTDSEYVRLSELLADPRLPLGGYTFEKLIQSGSEEQIDGVSGATSEEVLNYVVEGAAYTTYTLWNIVHGSIQDRISGLTQQKLNSSLLQQILNCPDKSDQIWGLERLKLQASLDDDMIRTLMQLIKDEDFFISYYTLKSILPNHLNSSFLQTSLFDAYLEAPFEIKSIILDKLAEAPELDIGVIEESTRSIKSLNGEQLVNLLKLYTRKNVANARICRALDDFAQSDNYYVRNQVHKYLDTLPCNEQVKSD